MGNTSQGTKLNILELKHAFSWIQCSHVHGIFNSMADSLSKLALDKQIGWMFFDEILEHSIINSRSFYSF